MPDNIPKWKFAVDRGGTFTDVVALDPSGVFHTLKLLSNSPAYKDASIEGIHRILGTDPLSPLPEGSIEGIRFGTTVATNALLERKGCRVLLLITGGFAGLLEIGYQSRPEIFSLCIKKATPVYNGVVEIDERIDFRGEVVTPLHRDSLVERLKEAAKGGFEAAAVVLMHAWKNPAHELLCEEVLKDTGFSSVFLSHRSVNLIKIISRGQSTLVDAYLGKVLAVYMEEIRSAAGGVPVEFMQSNGNPVPPDDFTGKNALLSGPAGGVIAVAGLAGDMNLKAVVGFDMGGTSTDVSRFDGRFEKVYEHIIGGIPIQAEMLDIITVAAGGGSVLGFDGQRMTAGPESAGASPGPACYGLGGPLTVTDANLLAGRIVPGYFPSAFGHDGKSPLDIDVVKKKFTALAEEIDTATGGGLTAQDIAGGYLKVANEKMAAAIKEISVSRGGDIRDYALVCFGGAGGQHACSIADLLEIDTIVIHPLGSVMSAYGIGLSRPAWKAERTVLSRYEHETDHELAVMFKKVEKKLLEGKMREGRKYIIRREIDLRPAGTEAFLSIEYLGFEETAKRFRVEYERMFGLVPDSAGLEVVNLRVEVSQASGFFGRYKETSAGPSVLRGPEFCQEVFYEGDKLKVPVYLRESVPFRTEISGPAFILDNNSTVIIDPGYVSEIDENGVLIINRRGERTVKQLKSPGGPDPVLLEVFNNLFMSAATEMGLTLQKTAYSVNMKERLDFSCALFDAEGGLVANAPHIPVHLGSMADTVKALIEDTGEQMKPGDIYLTNNPYRGGSHLSDMTVVSPVFSDKGDIIFFTAVRGHHSDVGGTTPGSMPPVSGHIKEEGVLVDGFLLVRGSMLMEDELKDILLGHEYPARNIPERISDLRAQIAACRKGEQELYQIISRYGLSTVSAYMGYVQDNAEHSVKRALYRFLDEEYWGSGFKDYMDDGTLVGVAVSITGGSAPPDTIRAVIDFSRTGGQHLKDNLNAPVSVVRSAVMYVLRVLTDADIPLNSGCLRPVEIIIPPGTLLNPSYPAPVATGNVETSQRVVDVLLGAFGVAAASQGTMNNLLFEVDGETPYYETIAGGSGAVEGCPGSSGVQVHMTNTRMTDPEILEFRHPGVRLERFTNRKGSGGGGRFPGGDGVIREIRFMKPATVSILSERRVYAPYGMSGGGPALKGVNLLKKADGSAVELGHRVVLRLDENDKVVIETPGGGGYGS